MHKAQQHNPLANLMRFQIDASIELADAVFSGTEKIDRAMLDVTHHAVEEQLKLARAVADLRDQEKLAELRVSIADRPEKTMRFQQEIMAAIVEMQAECGRSIRHYMERIGQTAAEQAGEVGERLSAGAHETSLSVSNPFTGMLSVWEQAFREASKLTQQNIQVARSGVGSALHTAQEAVTDTVEASSGAVAAQAHGGKGRGSRK